MTIRSSAIWAISDNRWLETSTALPCAANHRRKSRSHRIPCGSRPFAGSSRIRTRGSPSSAPASPAAGACRASTCRPSDRRRREPDLSEHLVDAAVDEARSRGQDAQMVPARPQRMEALHLQHGADGCSAGPGLRRAGPARSPSPTWANQPQHHPQRRALARTVRPEEPGDLPRPHLEAQVVDRGDRAEPLRQVPGHDRRRADARSCRRRQVGVVVIVVASFA